MTDVCCSQPGCGCHGFRANFFNPLFCSGCAHTSRSHIGPDGNPIPDSPLLSPRGNVVNVNANAPTGPGERTQLLVAKTRDHAPLARTTSRRAMEQLLNSNSNNSSPVPSPLIDARKLKSNNNNQTNSSGNNWRQSAPCTPMTIGINSLKPITKQVFDENPRLGRVSKSSAAYLTSPIVQSTSPSALLRSTASTTSTTTTTTTTSSTSSQTEHQLAIANLIDVSASADLQQSALPLQSDGGSGTPNPISPRSRNNNNNTAHGSMHVRTPFKLHLPSNPPPASSPPPPPSTLIDNYEKEREARKRARMSLPVSPPSRNAALYAMNGTGVNTNSPPMATPTHTDFMADDDFDDIDETMGKLSAQMRDLRGTQKEWKKKKRKELAELKEMVEHLNAQMQIPQPDTLSPSVRRKKHAQLDLVKRGSIRRSKSMAKEKKKENEKYAHKNSEDLYLHLGKESEKEGINVYGSLREKVMVLSEKIQEMRRQEQLHEEEKHSDLAALEKKVASLTEQLVTLKQRTITDVELLRLDLEKAKYVAALRAIQASIEAGTLQTEGLEKSLNSVLRDLDVEHSSIDDDIRSLIESLRPANDEQDPHVFDSSDSVQSSYSLHSSSSASEADRSDEDVDLNRLPRLSESPPISPSARLRSKSATKNFKRQYLGPERNRRWASVRDLQVKVKAAAHIASASNSADSSAAPSPALPAHRLTRLVLSDSNMLEPSGEEEESPISPRAAENIRDKKFHLRRSRREKKMVLSNGEDADKELEDNQRKSIKKSKKQKTKKEKARRKRTKRNVPPSSTEDFPAFLLQSRVLEQLPERLLGRIASYLDVRDITNLSSTNARFRRFCNQAEVWHNLCLKRQLEADSYKRRTERQESALFDIQETEPQYPFGIADEPHARSGWSDEEVATWFRQRFRELSEKARLHKIMIDCATDMEREGIRQKQRGEDKEKLADAEERPSSPHVTVAWRCKIVPYVVRGREKQAQFSLVVSQPPRDPPVESPSYIQAASTVKFLLFAASREMPYLTKVPLIATRATELIHEEPSYHSNIIKYGGYPDPLELDCLHNAYYNVMTYDLSHIPRRDTHTTYYAVSLIRAPLHITLDLRPRLAWKYELSIEGEWNHETAGGCMNENTFERNPFYLLSVPKSARGGQKLPICVMLEQRKLHSDGVAGQILPYDYYVGFYVLNEELSEELTAPIKWKNCYRVHTSFVLDTSKDRRFVVVPTTFKAKQETTFALHVLCDHQLKLQLLDA